MDKNDSDSPNKHTQDLNSLVDEIFNDLCMAAGRPQGTFMLSLLNPPEAVPRELAHFIKKCISTKNYQFSTYGIILLSCCAHGGIDTFWLSYEEILIPLLGKAKDLKITSRGTLSGTEYKTFMKWARDNGFLNVIVEGTGNQASVIEISDKRVLQLFDLHYEKADRLDWRARAIQRHGSKETSGNFSGTTSGDSNELEKPNESSSTNNCVDQLSLGEIDRAAIIRVKKFPLNKNEKKTIASYEVYLKRNQALTDKQRSWLDDLLETYQNAEASLSFRDGLKHNFEIDGLRYCGEDWFLSISSKNIRSILKDSHWVKYENAFGLLTKDALYEPSNLILDFNRSNDGTELTGIQMKMTERKKMGKDLIRMEPDKISAETCLDELFRYHSDCYVYKLSEEEFAKLGFSIFSDELRTKVQVLVSGMKNHLLYYGRKN